MVDSIKVGDHVTWKSSGGMSEGVVIKKLTSESNIKRHSIKAFPQHPEFIVKSDSSGATAAHKPETLSYK